MPSGDLVLAELACSLRGTDRGEVQAGEESVQDKHQGDKIYAISAATVVNSFCSSTPKGSEKTQESPVPVGEILIGETSPLEKAIQQSRDNSKKVLLVQATIKEEKVEGIGTNAAVMKVLLSRQWLAACILITLS